MGAGAGLVRARGRMRSVGSDVREGHYGSTRIRTRRIRTLSTTSEVPMMPHTSPAVAIPEEVGLTLP